MHPIFNKIVLNAENIHQLKNNFAYSKTNCKFEEHLRCGK
jgi:hypothetical protein